MELLKTELTQDNPPVLRIEGEVDLSTAGEMRTALVKTLSSFPTVIVDMAGVTFIDVAGVRTLLHVAESLNGRGPLPLVNAPQVGRILELVGLSDVNSIDLRDVNGSDGS